MARRRARAAPRLALLALAPPGAWGSCGRPCAGAPGAALLNATPERCLQRCRDALGGCERVAHDAAEGCCVLGPGPGGCGAGWALESASGCGYGRGRPLPSGACAACAAGSASHGDVGDLAGAWRLRGVGGADAGRLVVGSGGEARYSGGARGQFVLWHPRHDPNYPGAFFLEHAAPAAGPARAGGWDYAWLEDRDAGPPRLVVRRFCGAGPLRCAQLTSPEGSPLFEETLLGEHESAGEAPCDLLEGQGQGAGGQGPGTCCAAAMAVVEVQGQALTASIEIVGQGHWDHLELVNASWNTAPYDRFQNASLFFDSSSPELCSPSTSQMVPAATGVTVALAKRGDCIFAQKATSAHQSGAQGLIVVNTVGLEMPEFLRNAGGATSAPPVPTWMISATPGVEIMTRLSQGAGHEARVRMGRFRTVDDPALRDLCCQESCRERVRYSVANGRGGGIDVAGTCAQVDCSSFSPAPAPPAPVVLPHAGDACAPCPAGLAAAAEGQASCGACGDGQRASAGGASCEPCPAGSAGLAGQCSPCGAGLEPDALRRSCVPAPTPAPSRPIDCPVCTGAGNCPTTTAAPASSGAGDDRSEPTVIRVTRESGFNWGAMFGAVLSLSSLGCLGWLLRKMYLSYQLSGEVDTLGIVRGTCGGLCGFGAAMAAAATGRAVGRGAAAAQAGGQEGAGAGAEGADAEAPAAEGRREGRGARRAGAGGAEEGGAAEGGGRAARRGGSSQSLERGPARA